MIKPLWKRILLSAFLLCGAFALFYFPVPTEMTETVCANPLIERKTDNSGIIKLANYAGLFCLVFSVWIWRDLLKITSIGFIGGNDLRPSDPKTVDDSFKDDKDVPVKTRIEEQKVQERKNAILQFMRESYTSVTRTTILSHKLNLSKEVVDACLFELQVEGLVRKDILPGTLIGNYSLTESWINQAIDDYKKRLIEKKEDVVSDLRYIRTKKNREIDSILETESISYIFEIKSISKYLDTKVIERGIKQLLAIEEEYKTQKSVQLVLLLVLHKDFDMDIAPHLDEFLDVKDNLSIATHRRAF